MMPHVLECYYIDLKDEEMMSEFTWTDDVQISASTHLRRGIYQGRPVFLVESDGVAYAVRAEEPGESDFRAHDTHGNPLGPED